MSAFFGALTNTSYEATATNDEGEESSAYGGSEGEALGKAVGIEELFEEVEANTDFGAL